VFCVCVCVCVCERACVRACVRAGVRVFFGGGESQEWGGNGELVRKGLHLRWHKRVWYNLRVDRQGFTLSCTVH
jgi:hypothetical protein